MARPTHYDTLGLRPSATEKEVKAAYRRVVLRHHPDRSSDPASGKIFLAATEAYEVLGDSIERRRYDQGLESEARREAEKAAEEKRRNDADSRVRAARAASTAPNAPPVGGPATGGASVATQLARLSMLFSRGLYAEAEKLADEIVRRDPRQSLPYAVRGDLARGRGKLDEAARQYSLAIQMDPHNATYLKRYEEVLDRAQPVSTGEARMEPTERMILGSLFLGAILLLAAAFTAFTYGKPVLLGLSLTALASLFLCGVAAGACLSAAEGLDRLDAYATGGIGPTVALGLVSLVSFPAAAALYLALGFAQKGFNASTTRLFGAVAVVVAVLTIATMIARTGSDPTNVALWGGNLAYLGSLCGWAVADGLKR